MISQPQQFSDASCVIAIDSPGWLVKAGGLVLAVSGVKAGGLVPASPPLQQPHGEVGVPASELILPSVPTVGEEKLYPRVSPACSKVTVRG